MAAKSIAREKIESKISGIIYDKYSSARSSILNSDASVSPGSKFIFEISMEDIDGLNSPKVLKNVVEKSIHNLFPNDSNISIVEAFGGTSIVVSFPTEMFFS